MALTLEELKSFYNGKKRCWSQDIPDLKVPGWYASLHWQVPR